VLEIPLEEIPAFNLPNEDGWWERFREWLFPRGYAPLILADEPPELRPCWSLAGGEGPRGLKHSVVWRHGEMVHDPHPSREGLLEVEDFIYLVPLDPALSEIAVPLRPRKGT
jgi:hypothetical protein